MIAAGLLLLAVGGVDLLRRLITRRRPLAFAVAGAVLVAMSAGADAIVAGILALAVAAIWTWVVPESGSARTGLWPVGLLGVTVAACVVVAPARSRPGLLGSVWEAYGPRADVSIDVLLLVAGCLLFLLESGNAVVRIALRAEMGERVLPATGDAPATLKGGRLIGPLERILVFALTLAGAYTLLAAVLAAKGIVRFPEISRDGEGGDRAEYFLIGSLVSWVTALAAAFTVWWGVQGG
ncbi:hypothetical protein D8Y23_16045 [Microbacterium enclense]|uniref:Uncharacterized protein n=1 Tax=Microbacterium enclense TaxID=993073 RepID=A0A3S3LRX2_9MICO|nr:hypothetical protein [Microbacterium enclense]RWR15637.1 hypothetical protein D8Y23_16045 [Microbacterium enclense]